MRKFETSNSSEEKSKIVFGEIESEKLLLLENSSFGNLQKSEEEQTSTSLPLIKRKHSRLTSAFRSFRGSRSGKNSKSVKLETDTAEALLLQTSEELPLVKEIVKESIKVQLTPKLKKKKSKLSKRFSLSAIRRHKVSPRKTDLGELVSSSTQTPINLNRPSSSPEGGNLNISQLSLVDFASHSGTELDSSPVKFEKVRKIQITISGKKIPRSRKSHSVTTTSSKGEEDYLTVVSEANSIEKSDTESSPQKKGEAAAGGETELSQYQQPEKINITESNRDTPPRERAPARPELSPQRSDSTDRSEPEGVGTGADASGKGAIRKNRLKRQKESIEIEDYMHREERGRRFPRPQANKHPTIETQQTLVADTEEVQRYHGETTTHRGNSVQNPNLSGSIADKSFDSTEQPLSARETRIQFALGKEARGQVLRTQSSESKDLSSIGSNRSSESQSPVSESSLARRRIRYVEQPTLYTDEERDILAGRRDGLIHLSGISEYSFDSEFSVETQMPAFGDLTMEEAPIMTSSSGQKREHLYKILVIGELGTGKTSFIKRYVHQFFSQNYRATIGVDFALKVLQWDQNTIVRLQLWDIAGQERFGNMTRVYYKEAVGAFIVFDVTRSGTFDCVSKWKEDLDSKVQLPDGSPIPCILLANKCDQEKQGIATTPEKMDEYVKENGFAGWFETSAKENVNINEAARALVNKILLNDKLISAADIMDSEKFALPGGNGGKSSQNKKSCSC